MSYIYCIENKINHKKYVGATNDFNTRVRYHKSFFKKLNSKLYNSIQRYGIDNFEFSILQQCDELELPKLEKIYVEQMNSLFPKGYNEIRKFDHSSGFTHSEASKEKIRAAKLGELNPMYGGQHTNEAKAKIKNGVLNSTGSPILLIQFSTNQIIGSYRNRTFAEKETGIMKGTIWSRLNNKLIIDDLLWIYKHDYTSGNVKCNDYRTPKKPFGK